MSRSWVRPLALVFCLALGAALAADSEDEIKADLAALKAAPFGADTPSLVAFVKKRTLSEEQRGKIDALIEQLGAPVFADREKASMDLADLEELPRAQLNQALKADDPEIRRRARAVLTQLGPKSKDAKWIAPAARVLAARRPDGVAGMLLDFLPCVDDPDIADEVAAAIEPLGVGKDGKPDAAVIAAISDRAVIKRAAAGRALARAAATRALAHKMLKDADAGVRRKVGVALLEARDRDAVPALLAMLATAAGDDYAAIEDALVAVAGEKSPEQPSLDTPKAREMYHRQWATWWADHGKAVDLDKIDFAAAGRGHTLVTMHSTKGVSGSVIEMDAKGKVRWRIDNLNYPVHASMPRRDRVLICEYNLNRVTERDLKGKILWTRQVNNQVLAAERLPNGHTFIAMRGGLLVVDKDGRQVQSVPRGPIDIVAAHRYKDGRYAFLTNNGLLVQLDKDGKPAGSFSTGRFISAGIGFRAHFLPKGGVVVPDYTGGKIREYDPAGKVVWEIDANRPSAAMKLPNGNVLYASRLRTDVVEVDKNGREVSRRETDGKPLFLDRR